MITGKTSKLQNSDQGMFLGNCPPTPLPPQPSTQHFAQSEKYW